MNPRIEELQSLENAFEAMSAVEQAKAIRVSEYADVLFLELCAWEPFEDEASIAVCSTQMREAVRLAARYHNIGKTLVPSLYHEDRDTLTEEERAVYRHYTQDSTDVVIRWPAEELTDDAQRAVMEAGVREHRELWNGTGWPSAKKGSEINLAARVVSACILLDEMAMTKVCESPFDQAYNALLKMGGAEIDPIFPEVLPDCKTKLRRVFRAHADDSKKVEPTIQYIKRRSTRPMFLMYRPVVDMKDGTIGWQASPRFRYTYNNKSGLATYDVVQERFKNAGREEDLGTYFLQELCDLLPNLKACRIPERSLMIELPKAWFGGRHAVIGLTKVLADSEIDPANVTLLIDAVQAAAAGKLVQSNLQRIAASGVRIMVNGACPAEISAEACAIPGISGVVLAPGFSDALETEEAQEYLEALREQELLIYADGVEHNSAAEALAARGVVGKMGLAVGDFRREREVLNAEIADLEGKAG